MHLLQLLILIIFLAGLYFYSKYDENKIIEDEKNFRNKLSKAFKDQLKCELIDSQESNRSNPSYLLNYYNKILNHDLFNYSKEDNKTFNIKDNKAIYDIAMEFEKEWINKIRKG